MSDIKIGDTLYRFDENRRVYERGPDGRTSINSKLIYRGHFAPITVIGETSRSWICGNEYFQIKRPKSGRGNSLIFTEDEMEQRIYIKENAHKIVWRVQCLEDANKLKAIAEIVNYKAGDQ